MNNLRTYFNGINIFDFIRGIALLCVIGIHTVCVVNPAYPTIHYSKIYHTPAWISMWIFFFLSGYLLGKGFYNNKYKTDKAGILKFYISRFIRIVPMYLLFLFILFLFYNPLWFINNPVSVFHLLSFTYNGSNGIIGIGALWFVSTIMQLYILAPFAYKIMSKIKKNQLFILILIIVLGCAYRLLTCLFKLEYSNSCYTFSLANIDLFCGAMFFNAITQNSKDNSIKKYLRPISIILLFTIILLYIYSKLSNWLYSYICPTITLVIMLLLVYAFDSVDKVESQPLTIKNVIKNPIRFVEYLGVISFTFYLYHSNIIKISMEILKDPTFPYVIGNSHLYRYTFILMFSLTFILSVIMHYILEKPANILRKKYSEQAFTK